MKKVFIPIFATCACIASGCSLEPVICKDNTWARVIPNSAARMQ